jgi:hypothetical protein
MKDIAEEFVRRLVARQHTPLRVGQLVMNEQAFVRAIVVQLVEHVFDLARRDMHAQVVAGNGFEIVGFVEDDDVVVGQDARAPRKGR